MRSVVEISVGLTDAADDAFVKQALLQEAGAREASNSHVRMLLRSLDTRQRTPKMHIRAEVYTDELPPAIPILKNELKDANQNRRVVIVGAGPAGYFAALELLRHGIKPIVLDRGKNVRERRKDLRAIQQFGIVNPHSNYCFGEGGAGTYSDGKLYTRSKKRGSVERVLQLLVEHGANSDIQIDAHPHIGSNKLWLVVQEIRHTIESHGGEVQFGAFVKDFLIVEKSIKGVVLDDGTEVVGDAVILATGHSARDIYKLCVKNNINIEAKPFALGVRIEHPQPLINALQYKQPVKRRLAHKQTSTLTTLTNKLPHEHTATLPSASYALTCQLADRGVFSFCMCPGGLIVPSATSDEEIVVNGMSMSRRDSPYANAGTVVAVDEKDWKDYTEEHGALAAMQYQSDVERKAFSVAQQQAKELQKQTAPAQRLTDYLKNKVSSTLPGTSYIPGLISADMRSVLPPNISESLRQGILKFEKSMPGYITEEAILVGVESRTSAPVRIPRNKETLEHDDVESLYPCGEGAGYAGGIVSAAIDGMNVAQVIAAKIFRAT